MTTVENVGVVGTTSRCVSANLSILYMDLRAMRVYGIAGQVGRLRVESRRGMMILI